MGSRFDQCDECQKLEDKIQVDHKLKMTRYHTSWTQQLLDDTK